MAPVAVTEVGDDLSTLLLTAHVPSLVPDELYAYWTDADLMVRWWPPEAEIDARPGGEYHLAWPLTNWHLRGVFGTVTPPSDLSFSWHWDHEPEQAEERVTLHIEPNPEGGSTLHLEHGPYESTEAGQARRQGHLDGWQYFLDRLVTLTDDDRIS